MHLIAAYFTKAAYKRVKRTALQEETRAELGISERMSLEDSRS